MKKCVVLFSGGLDSSLICHLLKQNGYDISPLYIDYGQINIKQELSACKEVGAAIGVDPIEVLNIHDYGRLIPSGLTNNKLDIEKEAFLAGRNVLFLLCAAAYAYSLNINNIAIGLLSSEDSIFPDQTSTFVSSMRQLIHIAISPNIKLMTPLSSFCKKDVIKLAKSEKIYGTYSCHKGGKTPCGECIACKEFIGG
jgi:7-cyano-7-deazaguanine synthase